MQAPEAKTARQKQIEALFEEFIAMPERSYGKLGRKHGIEGPELQRHARAFLWPERINALKIRHNEQTSTASGVNDDAGAAEINRLHLTRMKLLQQKAMEYLEGCTFDKPDTALRMLVEAMKMEREIKGLTKDKVDDLKSILMQRIKEAEAEPAAAPGVPEFDYDPQFQVETLDGPEGNPPPPSGGDHAQ